MKSLSKGNNSRRDPLSSSNLRESTVLPGSSILAHNDTLEDEITYVSSDRNRFGWPKYPEREPSPPNHVDHVPPNGQRGSQNDRNENEHDYLGPITRKTIKRVDDNQLSVASHFQTNHSDPDDNLNALLKVWSFATLPKVF